jgi:preprotein translocase subunit SecA
MRIFGSDRMGGMLQRLGLKPGEAIVHPWINKALEKAQKKVEARNFDTRKNVLKYDDVMNDQRKEVYAQRKEFMKADDVSETVVDMRAEILASMVARRVPEKAFSEQWELAELAADVNRLLGADLPIEEWGREEGIDETHLRERIEQAADSLMAAKAANMGPELMRFIEKSLLIQTLDAVWKEHLYALDHLRQGIGLRAYGQRDPLNEYKSEAFALFNAMLDELKERVTGLLARVELATEQPPPPLFPQHMMESHPMPAPTYAGESDLVLEPAGGGIAIAAQPLRADAVDPNDPATWRNAGRNAACPCGSGRKYKHCHGRLA